MERLKRRIYLGLHNLLVCTELRYGLLLFEEPLTASSHTTGSGYGNLDESCRHSMCLNLAMH